MLSDITERELIKFIYIVWIFAKNGINLGVLTSTGLLFPLAIFSKIKIVDTESQSPGNNIRPSIEPDNYSNLDPIHHGRLKFYRT